MENQRRLRICRTQCAALALLLCLAACASPEPRRNEKALGGLGAVLGGLAGSTIGQGAGRTAATIGGAIGGAILGSEIDAEKDLAVERAEEERSAPAREGTVIFPGEAPSDGGSLGSPRTLTTGSGPPPRRCEERRRLVMIDGKQVDAIEKACQGPDGRWVIVPR